MTSVEEPAPAMMVMVTQHLHPLGTALIAHDNTHLAEQTAPHGISDAPNVTRLGTGHRNAAVVSHLHQRLHLHQRMHLCMGSPDAHL